MTDSQWLHEMFDGARRELAELPDWARPVVTPPATTDADAAAPTSAEPTATETPVVDVINPLAEEASA